MSLMADERFALGKDEQTTFINCEGKMNLQVSATFLGPFCLSTARLNLLLLATIFIPTTLFAIFSPRGRFILFLFSLLLFFFHLFWNNFPVFNFPNF